MNVAEIMSTTFARIDANASMDQAIERMEADDVRHLPVMDGDALAGVLSERDVLSATGWLPPSVRRVIEAPEGDVKDFMHSPVVTVSPTDTLATAALRMLDWGIGCLPVLDERDLVGMLTELDLLDAYVRACRGDVLTVASDPAVSTVMSTELSEADAATPAEEALEFCRTKSIRHLPVLDEGELVGIVSDRDLRLSVGRGDLEGTELRELVPERLLTIAPDEPLSRAAEAMVRHRISALPVVDDGELIGLVTTTDVVRHGSIAFGRKGAPA